MNNMTRGTLLEFFYETHKTAENHLFIKFLDIMKKSRGKGACKQMMRKKYTIKHFFVVRGLMNE